MLRLIIDQNYCFTLTHPKYQNTLLITKLKKIHQRANNHIKADINEHKLIKNKITKIGLLHTGHI